MFIVALKTRPLAFDLFNRYRPFREQKTTSLNGDQKPEKRENESVSQKLFLFAQGFESGTIYTLNKT